MPNDQDPPFVGGPTTTDPDFCGELLIIWWEWQLLNSAFGYFVGQRSKLSLFNSFVLDWSCKSQYNSSRLLYIKISHGSGCEKVQCR